MLKDSAAPIIHMESWGTYHLLAARSPEIAAQAAPGQFIMVRTSSQYHPLLRRPFSLHAVSEDQVFIFFQNVGTGTRILGQVRPGMTLDILGPLGHGFDLNGNMQGLKTALVGGGRGIAPLYFLAEQLIQKKAEVRIFYGGRSHPDLVLQQRFQDAGMDLSCATDDGSQGFAGLVTDCLKSSLSSFAPDRLYACGPDAMLQAISSLSRTHAIPAELSLESIMGCGFGACWGCVRRIRRQGEESWHKICEEGPVFPAESIIWEEDLS